MTPLGGCGQHDLAELPGALVPGGHDGFGSHPGWWQHPKPKPFGAEEHGIAGCVTVRIDVGRVGLFDRPQHRSDANAPKPSYRARS